MENIGSAPSTRKPLRIVVLGTGSIGSAFAFQLARRGGHEVTVVARPGSTRLAQLRRDGGIVDVKGERADLHVTDALDEQMAYDLVIVTLLAHQVGALLPALQRSAARWIQFMFNDFGGLSSNLRKFRRPGARPKFPGRAAAAAPWHLNPRVCQAPFRIAPCSSRLIWLY